MGLFKKKKSKQEIAFMERQVPGFGKQLGESADLIKNTVNPNVFFMRYDFIIQTLERLVEI
jgi:hypothetical protein